MDTKKLRQKILDLAIRGKLVPQDPNDEPAFELLKRINPEFEACDNTPRIYSIPNSWCWTTLGCVCDIVTGSTPSKTQLEYYGGEFPFYKPSDLDAGRHVTIPSEYLSEAGKKVSRIIPKDSTAICCIGSIGKCGYIEKEGTTNQQINTAVPSKGLNPLYLYYFCNSTFFGDNLSADSSAITISIVNKSKLGKMHMPVPPIAEQKRIVAAIEHWFALIDVLENEKSDLQASIQQAKSKILDLAIHGKLVPQDPNDEPAIELLKRINPEFEDCEHSNNHVIHSGWCVAKLEDVIELLDNKRIPIKSEDREQRVKNKEIVYPYYGATGLVGYIDDYLLDGRYILLGEDGAPFEDKYANVAYEVYGKIWVNNHAHVVSPKISFEYLLYSLNAVDYTLYAKGTTRLKLTQKDMLSIPVSVPPYQEQLRIVTKIEELFAILDSIKESLE